MCFNRKEDKARRRIKRVYPEPPPPSFTVDEVIKCSGCNENFTLSEMKIYCAGCEQFFHCKIAGTCYGKHCLSETRTGKQHNLSWCLNCVFPLPQNTEKESRIEECICKNCYKY